MAVSFEIIVMLLMVQYAIPSTGLHLKDSATFCTRSVTALFYEIYQYQLIIQYRKREFVSLFVSVNSRFKVRQ